MKALLIKLVCLLAILGYAGIAYAEGDKASSLPKWPEPKGEKCVEPTQVMREQHMDFILHQRDETMHKGIRGAKHSLKDCIDCHVGYDTAGKALPINDEGQFCESCHTYAAVRIDCFGCHRTTPPADKKPHAMMQPIQNPHNRPQTQRDVSIVTGVVTGQ